LCLVIGVRFVGFWFLLFFLTPIVEMYLLIEVGGHIGALPTIGLVMFTAVVGLALLRNQGLATLTRGMGRLQRGEVPAQEMAEGILLAVAGALLITPGFATDAIGFFLLLPAGRGLIAARIASRFAPPGSDFGPFGPFGPTDGDGVIEGEFESRTDTTDRPD
jgi:UPF0716 protein FxsA